jgi:Rod binding domain-containing protein
MEPVQNNPVRPFLPLQKPDARPLKEGGGSRPHGSDRLGGPAQPGDEAAQLRKAAKDFESVFVAQVLKQMRETVHKEEMFHGGPGEDLFEGLLDEEISKRIAGQGSMGIGELLYRDLSRRFHIGQENGTKGPVDPALKKFLPLHPQPGAKADAAAPRPSPSDAATDIRAQVRKLRQQGLGIEGATLRR